MPDMVCKLWLTLCAASLITSECLRCVHAFEESCSEEFCDRSHTLTDQLPDDYVIEQQNKDILEKSFQEQLIDPPEQTSDDTQQISHNAEPNSHEELIESHDALHDSHQTFIDKSQNEDMFLDKHSKQLDSSAEFQEVESNEIIDKEPNLNSKDVEDKDVSLLNDATDDQQQETDILQLEVVGFSKGRIQSDIESVDAKENTEQYVAQPVSRRKYFPLFYTIRSLLTSLLSEFGDESGNQETSFNSSEIATGNVTTAADQLLPINATANGTDSSRKTRFQCPLKNITSNTTGVVKIVNSTELLEILNFSKNQKVSPCVLVMFYAPWCHFCAKAAPHYNALARAFPQLDVLAVDTSHFSYLNARFGTVAVPNLMLFHARSAVRFNHTARLLDNFIQFVTNNTGIESDKSVTLEPTDLEGPMPSQVVQARDWLLWLAWTFVIICSVFGFVRSQYGQSVITRMRVLWQEHQHIE
ncbi:hypothetical protein BsWGS_20969 [Bradybaena similaris]